MRVVKAMTGLAARILRRRDATMSHDAFADADRMTQADLADIIVHLHGVLCDNDIDF